MLERKNKKMADLGRKESFDSTPNATVVKAEKGSPAPQSSAQERLAFRKQQRNEIKEKYGLSSR